MNSQQTATYDVVIIGGGAGGISVASSLLNRQSDLTIAIIEPAEDHFYQPGWTMVGGGIFTQESTRKPMADVMPKKATWHQTTVKSINPDSDSVVLTSGHTLGYRRLIVAPGLVVDWNAISGLGETLGHNGVTSNYRYDLAPYTWSLVKSLKQGKALFTQPPMPIKCAGAPQKAMYMACDYWRKEGNLGQIETTFCNAGEVLFGVKDYVPALQAYIERYGIETAYKHRLTAVDGAAKVALFEVASENGSQTVERSFDMLHVVPPQKAPSLIAESGLANAGGWLDLNANTLQHERYSNIFGLGDASGTPNAKTAAAVRKQAPVVAQNVLASLQDKPLSAAYFGYGSCPLTVERGKIVLAEFGYNGQLQPTFPNWVNDGTRPTRAAWQLKAKALPWIYWRLMLRGKEWLS